MISYETREKISRAIVDITSRSGAVSIKPFMKYVHRAGYPSLGALAEAAGVSKQFISRVARGGGRMPATLAVKLEELIGYKASYWD